MAPAKIQQDLPAAKAVGEKASEILRVERLESQPAKTKFHDANPEGKAANIYRPEQKGALSQEQNAERDHPES